MNFVRVDHSHPGVVDVVLDGEAGRLPRAARRWLEEAFGSLAAGALYGAPVYLVMAMGFEQSPGRIWAAVGIAAALGLVVNTLALAYKAYRNTTRLRFSPAAGAETMTFVRGSRTDPPRPLADVQRIWIEQSVTESYKKGRKPDFLKVTLCVLLKNGRLVRPSPLLAATTDAAFLHERLREVLAATDVPVDLVVRRRVQSQWSGLGHGGSTGGGS
ncbi:hypothetical protein ABT160_36885 [Streptomyces sp. NPDC001941]|uniref:hypothetical protein n=1 Tax=Streptomyces sp. NPDC001941 TaxID=3154659 RepID=UPI00332128E2